MRTRFIPSAAVAAALAVALLAPAQVASAAPTPAVPFGTHPVTLPAGWASAPGGAAAADAATLRAYRAWKAAYLVQDCGAGRYYVDASTATPYTVVSEGQGYGMVIVPLMAGAEPDAQTIFDGLVRYRQDHPSENNPALMAWQQTDCDSEPDNAGSATDGDLDAAYGLLLAHRQWGSGGAIDYLGEAKKIIAALKASSFNPTTALPLFGDWVTKSDAVRWRATRASDLMIDHYRAFKNATGDVFWDRAASTADGLIQRMTVKHSPTTGLLPDFIVDTAGLAPRPAPADLQEGPHDGDAYWNASRVPWRLTANALLGSSPGSLDAIRKQTTWIVGATASNPASIRTGYKLDGTRIDDYNSLVFTAPFAAAGLTRAADQSWVNSVWANVSTRSDGYYADSVALQTMLLVSGNYWRP